MQKKANKGLCKGAEYKLGRAGREGEDIETALKIALSACIKCWMLHLGPDGWVHLLVAGSSSSCPIIVLLVIGSCPQLCPA